MTGKHYRWAVAVCLLAASTVSAASSSMRCGSSLVTTGDAMYEVIAKCGRPDAVHTSTVHGYYAVDRLRFATFVKRTELTEWTYNFGPQRFMRLLRFGDSRLLAIETLGYGYHRDR